MMEKKKGMSKMHPLAQKAKMGVVEHMGKMADDAMADKVKGLKKVSVASNSEEGLEHGLDKAKDILHGLPPAFDDSHPDHENAAHTENEEDGDDGMDSFPDSDASHDLELNPLKMHDHDERMEGGHLMAEGGEIDSDMDEVGDEGDGADMHEMGEDEIEEQIAKLMKMKEMMRLKAT